MKALVSDNSIARRMANVVAGSMHGAGATVQDKPMPVIKSNEIRVKVKAVALNPTDFKHIDFISPRGSISGCDFAGVVDKVGGDVKTWQAGDRVAGLVHGGLYPDRGAFAEYLKTDADLAWKIPADMSDTEAATYGVSAVTAMLTLNVRHGLPFPSPEAPDSETHAQQPPPSDAAVFIYAGSTSAGLYHIQIAKAAGYRVVTTASPHSFELVNEYGADAVYDYHSPTLAADIVADYPDMSKAVDCFSEGKSTATCAEVIKKKGGTVITLLPNGKSHIANVKYELVMAYTCQGLPFQWLAPVGPKYAAVPEDRRALARFYHDLPRLVHILKPIPTFELQRGFDGILEGLEKLRQGKVAGGKQVVVM